MSESIKPRMHHGAVAETLPDAARETGTQRKGSDETAASVTGRPARVQLGKELKQGVLFTLVTMVLLGQVYPSVLWAIGRVAFPAQAEGSLLRRADGTVVGSRLIAQRFTRPEYFLPRPSGVDYNAASTGGTNYGPSNPDHLKAVAERLAAITAREHVTPQQVPSEMVTASGAGLDPHIPPEAAEMQVARVATARGVDPARVRELVARHSEPPSLGFLGGARVNVLELNVDLDEALGPPPAAK